MVEMFQTASWDALMNKYMQDLTDGAAVHVVPMDIQVKVGPFAEYEEDGAVVGVMAQADLPEINDECFFGAIIQAENDRFFAFELVDGEPEDHLSEVDVDNTDLLETHVILLDNAETVPGEEGPGCPNAYKNKKPYKELNAPIKILPYNADNRQIVYSIRIIIRYPTDPEGNQEPPLNYYWLPAEGSGTVSPYALIIMPALMLVKPACIHAPPTAETECPTTTNLLLE